MSLPRRCGRNFSQGLPIVHSTQRQVPQLACVPQEAHLHLPGPLSSQGSGGQSPLSARYSQKARFRGGRNRALALLSLFLPYGLGRPSFSPLDLKPFLPSTTTFLFFLFLFFSFASKAPLRSSAGSSDNPSGAKAGVVIEGLRVYLDLMVEGPGLADFWSTWSSFAGGVGEPSLKVGCQTRARRRPMRIMFYVESRKDEA